jgi:hypothetical protein
MKRKYKIWIEDNGFNIPEIVESNCEKICELMIDAFPNELEIQCGNIFLIDGKNNKQSIYHWWLKDKESGDRIDPSFAQFKNFTVVEYKGI